MTKKNKNILTSILIVVGCIALVVGVYFLFREKETVVTSDASSEKTNALVCEASSAPDGSFFISKTATKTSYTLKMTFSGSRANRISFAYTGEYANSEQADYDNASMHADYNKFAANAGFSPESYSPTFSYNNTRTSVNLMTETSSLKPSAAKLFYLESEDVQDIDKISAEKLSEIYQNKGFSCIINE